MAFSFRTLRRMGVLTGFCGALFFQWCFAQESLSSNSPQAARFEKARQADSQGDISSALQGYLSLSNGDPGDEFAIRALFRAGELYAIKQDYTNAFACYQQLLDSRNEGSLFLKAVGNQFAIAEKVVKTVTIEKSLIGKSASSTNGTYRQAAEMLQLILETASQTDFAPKAIFLLSALQAKTGDKETARETLQKLLKGHPDHSLADDADFQLAFYDYRDGIVGRGDGGPLERAEQALTYFLAKHPESDRQPVAKALLYDIGRRQYSALRETAFYYEKTGASEAAKKSFGEMILRFPELVAGDPDPDRIHRGAGLSVEPKATTTVGGSR